MGAKRPRISRISRLAVALLLPLGLALLTSQPVASYPTPSGTYEGWTAEADLGLANPRHVQIASSGGWLYAVYDRGSDVYFRRTNDLEGLTGWSSPVKMDTAGADTACDAYIDASGRYVAVSFKEVVNGRWSLVVKCSWDNGATWPYLHTDSGSSWNN